MKIGFIGLGNMGLPMAKRLVAAGYEVYGKNRSSGKEEVFAAAGGNIAPSHTWLAQHMDVIITCLPLPVDVEAVYLGMDGLIENACENLILIDSSTVSPSLSKGLFQAAADRGLAFLDAPVSGGTTGAADGTLTIMVGGQQATYDEVLPILQAMGKQIHYVGQAGSGVSVKLINQLMVGIHTQAVSEALVLAEQFGLDVEQLFSILNTSFAQSKMLERHYTQFIAKQNYQPGFAIELLSKDMNIVMDEAEAKGVNAIMGSAVKQLLQSAKAEGYGNKDMSAMYLYSKDQPQKDQLK